MSRFLTGPGTLGRTLAVAVALSLTPAGLPGQESAAPRPDSTLRVYGQADYGWGIRPLDGEPRELSAYRGEVLFINLWATWCRPCVRELEAIERLRDRLRGVDVRFLIVAAEGERPVERFLRRRPYDLPVYLEEEKVPASFGKIGLPTTWVVDRRGRIVLRRHGAAAWDREPIVDFLRAVARDGTAPEAPGGRWRDGHR